MHTLKDFCKVAWPEEIQRAIVSVEEFERASLAAAQQNRKRKLTGETLPLVSLPDPGPFTISAKRDHASRTFAAVLRDERHSRAIRALVQPTPAELRNDAINRANKRKHSL